MQNNKIIKLWLPIFIILGLTALFFTTGAYKFLTISAVRQHWVLVESHLSRTPLLFGLGFVLLYSAAVSIPTGLPVVLNIVAGMLFSLPVAIALVCLSELLGGWVLFAYANSALGQWAVSKAQGKLALILLGIKNNAISIVLGLRVICIVPCWLINLVSGLSGLARWQYSVITLVGSIPAAAIFSIIGSGVKKVVISDHELTMKAFWRLEFLVPLGVLILLICIFKLFQNHFKSS